MYSALSTTRTSHDCLFMPLGALMPHFRMVCMVSRFTGCGLYLRMLRRSIMVLTTASDWLKPLDTTVSSFCEVGEVQDMAAHRQRPPMIPFNIFISYIAIGYSSGSSSVSSSPSLNPLTNPPSALPAFSISSIMAFPLFLNTVAAYWPCNLATSSSSSWLRSS